MKNKLFISSLFIAGLYLGVCVYYYVNQERMIFASIPLEKEYTFQLENSFEEVFLETPDGIQLHGLFFQQENPKGVIYYLHGKSGNMKTWAPIANHYLDWGYDVFMLDYRGFGKSEGKINSEEQFYSDVQLGYDFLKNKYAENKISVVGFSLGSGAATHLAVKNNPKELILLAPYFQVDGKFKEDKFYLPKFLCKYEFPIDELLPNVKIPIRIYYGNEDEIINLNEVQNLESALKPTDLMIELNNQGHNGIEKNDEFAEYFQSNSEKNSSQNEFQSKFKEYATIIQKIKTSSLNFEENENKIHPDFIDYITDAAFNKPINFGGHYTIIQKSCGLDCEHIFMVDRLSGKVLNTNLTEGYCGFDYQATSNLLIANSNSLKYDDPLNDEENNCQPIFFVWNGSKFIEEKSN